MTASLPPIVKTAVEERLDGLDRLLPDLITGFHVIGSAALGDFRPGLSDIDIVAVTSRRIGRGDLPALALAYAARQGAPTLDGAHLLATDLRRDPATARPEWWTRDGRVRGPSMEMRNPLVWAELARHAYTLRGSPAHELGIETSPTAVDTWVRSNLQGYWRQWIGRARPLAALGLLRPTWLTWGVLGVSRSHHTLETGRIVSKTAAGLHAIERLAAFRPAIDVALELRSGQPVARVDRATQLMALRMMTQAVDDALRLPAVTAAAQPRPR